MFQSDDILVIDVVKKHIDVLQNQGENDKAKIFEKVLHVYEESTLKDGSVRFSK